MQQYHKLLQRQLRRYFTGDPALFEPLLRAVNSAYEEFDADRLALEHSLDLCSVEIQTANTKMRAIYERLILSSTDGIFAFDHDLHISVWNPAMERMSGIAAVRLIGKPIQDAIPSILDSADQELLRRTLQGHTKYIGDRAYAVAGDNERHFYESQFSPLFNEAGDIIGGLGILRDCTKRKLAEEAEQRQLSFLSALQETALGLNDGLTTSELFETIVAHSAEVLDTPHIVIGFIDQAGLLAIHHCAGAFRHLRNQALSVDEGTMKDVWSAQKPLMQPGPLQLAEVAFAPSALWVSVPLFRGAQCVGIIGVVYNLEGAAFDTVHYMLLKQFGQMISIALNQEALAQANTQLAALAYTDPLTGLLNHRSLMGHIDLIIEHCHTADVACAILFLDLDHFKRINDTWGHRAGDAILRTTAERLRMHLRPGDVIGRYGGEEFAVVLANTQLQEASECAERLRDALAATPYTIETDDSAAAQTAIAVTASIGVALYARDGVNREALIDAADGAMYQAKHTGRNRVCIAQHTPALQLIIPQQHQMQEDAVCTALLAIIAAHDNDTAQHSERISQWAADIAARLSCSDDEVQQIRFAAKLHDLGKIGMPTQLLNKQAPLNAEEWALIRQHPQVGEVLLRKLGGSFEQIAPIVGAHYERWDGTGYPHQLSGEEIPLATRILAVADAYDTMVAGRPYRPARTVSEAIAELQRCAGQQFDARVVAEMVQVVCQDDLAQVA